MVTGWKASRWKVEEFLIALQTRYPWSRVFKRAVMAMVHVASCRLMCKVNASLANKEALACARQGVGIHHILAQVFTCAARLVKHLLDGLVLVKQIPAIAQPFHNADEIIF